MGTLSELFFGKPRKGYPLKPVAKVEHTRNINNQEFTSWIKEMQVSSRFNHEESQETCQRLRILKYKRNLFNKELNLIITNPHKPIWIEGQLC